VPQYEEPLTGGGHIDIKAPDAFRRQHLHAKHDIGQAKSLLAATQSEYAAVINGGQQAKGDSLYLLGVPKSPALHAARLHPSQAALMPVSISLSLHPLCQHRLQTQPLLNASPTCTLSALNPKCYTPPPALAAQTQPLQMHH
jgi:hypothetical protein